MICGSKATYLPMVLCGLLLVVGLTLVVERRWHRAAQWDPTMDPAVRVLRQVTLDDAAAADELFSILMGEDVAARRSFIARNAKDVRFLDV